DHVGIQARFLQGTQLFSAKVKPAESPSILKSEVFDSLDGFVDFIKGGVTSYTPSVRDNYYARVDLYKEDARYEAVDATIDFNSLDLRWPEAGLIFDSAVRAGGGGLYKWTYRGEVPGEVRTESYPLLNSDTTSGIPSLKDGYLNS
ncbi:MAG: hypothetical protein MN733_12780, partial [Nitrososphaera sp.]|nr:hypothetical protein [Nitrososphaera sp.]